MKPQKLLKVLEKRYSKLSAAFTTDEERTVSALAEELGNKCLNKAIFIVFGATLLFAITVLERVIEGQKK